MSYIATDFIADTAIGEVTSLDATLPALNWAVDWAKTRDNPLDAELTYRPAPFDAPQTVRFSASKVGNVYANTPVDPSYQLPYKRGISIVCGLDLVRRFTKTDDPTYQVDLPSHVHIVVKEPTSGMLTADMVLADVLRCVSTMFNGALDSDRLNELLKGAMIPG